MLLLAPPTARPPLQNLRAQQQRNFANIRMATGGFCWHSKAILREEGIVFFLTLLSSPAVWKTSPWAQQATVSNPP